MKKASKLGIAPFDASDYLDNEETIAEYLSVALENPDPDAFLVAVGITAPGSSKILTSAVSKGLTKTQLDVLFSLLSDPWGFYFKEVQHLKESGPIVTPFLATSI